MQSFVILVEPTPLQAPITHKYCPQVRKIVPVDKGITGRTVGDDRGYPVPWSYKAVLVIRQKLLEVFILYVPGVEGNWKQAVSM